MNNKMLKLYKLQIIIELINIYNLNNYIYQLKIFKINFQY